MVCDGGWMDIQWSYNIILVSKLQLLGLFCFVVHVGWTRQNINSTTISSLKASVVALVRDRHRVSDYAPPSTARAPKEGAS